METSYTAIVRKRVRAQIPKLNGKGKPILQGPDGKPLPVNPDTGDQIGDGTPMMEIIESDSTDDPLTDGAGNTIEAGTPEALLRRVKEHFAEEENANATILHVTVRKTETFQEVTAEAIAALK